MSEELIVSHCSPTMAGLKTGNLFACPVKNREELKASLRRMNLRLVPRGVRMIPVRYSDNKALIYMYQLQEMIMVTEVSQILIVRFLRLRKR